MDKINKELNQSKIIIKEQNNKIKQNNERIEKLEEGTIKKDYCLDEIENSFTKINWFYY